MKKEELIRELQFHTRIMLKPSPVHGIGVFAIARIEKGEREIFSRNAQEWLPISIAEMQKLPAHVQQLIENYCLYDEAHYFIPEEGFKMLDLVVFLNHSDQPNIRSINEGLQFEALRNIDEGEELFIDYGTIVEAER
jgi:SET domain-containing protein